MKVSVGASSERVRVTLRDGASIADALAALTSEHGWRAGWVRGVGSVSSAELAGEGRLAGAMTVASLEGVLGPRSTLYVVLSKPDGRVVADRLIDARATSVELWLEPHHDAPAPSKRLVEAREPAERELEQDAPSEAPALSWADVAAASVEETRTEVAKAAWSPPATPSTPRRSRAPAPRDVLPELLPQKGDYVHHRQFGQCRVDGFGKGGGLVIRLPSGVRKTIRLDFMDVGEPRNDGGRRVFPVRPKPK
ncbi:MAG: DUF296 domain-containing protein [Sandaracinaceae bacterium]